MSFVSEAVMEAIWRMVVLLSLAVLGFGCGTSGYMADRRRDGADIFTATIGTGGIATARAGPLHAGLYWGHDRIGLRCGESFWRTDKYGDGSTTIDPLIVLPNVGGGPWVFWADGFRGWERTRIDGRCRSVAELRGKAYYAVGICPFLSFPRLSETDVRVGWRFPRQYLTQVEIALGLVKTLRLGINPGELLDFVIGWTTLDIFGDDIMRKREKAKHQR